MKAILTGVLTMGGGTILSISPRSDVKSVWYFIEHSTLLSLYLQ